MMEKKKTEFPVCGGLVLGRLSPTSRNHRMFQLLGLACTCRLAAIRGQNKQNRHPSIILGFLGGVGQYASISVLSCNWQTVLSCNRHGRPRARSENRGSYHPILIPLSRFTNVEKMSISSHPSIIPDKSLKQKKNTRQNKNGRPPHVRFRMIAEMTQIIL